VLIVVLLLLAFKKLNTSRIIELKDASGGIVKIVIMHLQLFASLVDFQSGRVSEIKSLFRLTNIDFQSTFFFLELVFN